MLGSQGQGAGVSHEVGPGPAHVVRLQTRRPARGRRLGPERGGGL